ncbi:MAG: hypothetical protein WCV59_01405 [Parcubacteria group bacterium]
MKSLTSVKKAAFVGVSSLVLALGVFAAPVAFAKENGNSGDHRGDRHSENRDNRGDRGDRHEGDRSGDNDSDNGSSDMGD